MKNKSLYESFKNAFYGIFQAFKTEKNIKLHYLFALIAIIIGLLLGFNIFEWLVLILTILIVLISEMINTAIEYTINLVCGSKYNEIARYAKDIAAGATLIGAIGSLIIFILLYLPKILNLLY